MRLAKEQTEHYMNSLNLEGINITEAIESGFAKFEKMISEQNGDSSERWQDLLKKCLEEALANKKNKIKNTLHQIIKNKTS